MPFPCPSPWFEVDVCFRGRLRAGAYSSKVPDHDGFFDCTGRFCRGFCILASSLDGYRLEVAVNGPGAVVGLGFSYLCHGGGLWYLFGDANAS